MTFEWPWALLLLLAVPALVLAHGRQQRQRRVRREALAAEGLLAPDVVAGGRLPHLAPLLLLGALAVLLVSLARPVATVAEPHREGTVVLAFDVSTSMAAKDVSPTRLDAAKAAARAFVARQPSSIRLGVVAFGDSALVAQQPTDDRSLVLAAIDRLTPQGGTSLGRGIVAALGAVAGKPLDVGTTADGSLDDADLGYHGSAAVVLLTDGENTASPDPTEVADLASAAGVRIYPIGVGSPQGTVLEVDGFQISTALDEPTLRRIAEVTNGAYRPAADAAQLTKVYDSIDLAWTTRGERREVTSWLAATAAALLLLGAATSVLRTGRVV